MTPIFRIPTALTLTFAMGLLATTALANAAGVGRELWTSAQAREWGAQTGWLAGANFIPSTAINELEMWQPDTFDLPTIDRELGWAEGLGCNTVRVFLHNIPWEQDPQAFLGRIDSFLGVAANARAQSAKADPSTVAYQTKPNNGQQCSTCTSFIAPAGCALVSGTIAPSAWCELYSPKS